MRAIFFCQILIITTLVMATLIGGICIAAEPGLPIHHNADVRLDPPSRHVQVTDELEIDAGGTIRFRLAPRLKPYGSRWTEPRFQPPAAGMAGASRRAVKAASGSSSAMRGFWRHWMIVAAHLEGMSRAPGMTAVSCRAERHGCPL